MSQPNMAPIIEYLNLLKTKLDTSEYDSILDTRKTLYAYKIIDNQKALEINGLPKERFSETLKKFDAYCKVVEDVRAKVRYKAYRTNPGKDVIELEDDVKRDELLVWKTEACNDAMHAAAAILEVSHPRNDDRGPFLMVEASALCFLNKERFFKSCLRRYDAEDKMAPTKHETFKTLCTELEKHGFGLSDDKLPIVEFNNCGSKKYRHYFINGFTENVVITYGKGSSIQISVLTNDGKRFVHWGKFYDTVDDVMKYILSKKV